MGLVATDDGWRVPDALWAKLGPLLPPRPAHRFGGHNPRVPDRDAMDAILFVLRTGCQWNALAATGICSSSSAYRRFSERTRAGVFLEFWRRGLLDCGRLKGIDWNWLAIDGAMSKAPLGGKEVGPNPTDRARRGVKRSLLTDGAWIPLGIAVDGANRNDFKLVAQTVESIPIARPRPQSGARQNLCLDKGYDYDKVRELTDEPGITAHIRGRGEEAAALKRSARTCAPSWVVERTHSRMNRFQRILVRWEEKAETYLAMLHMTLGVITWRATSLLEWLLSNLASVLAPRPRVLGVWGVRLRVGDLLSHAAQSAMAAGAVSATFDC